MAEATGKQIIKRVRVALAVMYVVSIALYVGYLVWVFRVADGATQWILGPMPLVGGAAWGFVRYRHYSSWLKG